MAIVFEDRSETVTRGRTPEAEDVGDQNGFLPTRVTLAGI